LHNTARPYSGRLLFDHFPKTAGQAINAWLSDVLGDGTVSPNLINTHRELRGHAGDYSVISGHVHFAEREGLDPRFQYATLLREPLDRTLSWLFFVTSNHEREQFPALYDEYRAFLDSDGQDLGPIIAGQIINPMVAHYAGILGSCGAGDDELVETAFRAVMGYDLVGIYERLDEFVAGLGELIGIPAPRTLQPVNVTVSRPARDGISAKLRDKLLAITELDRKLYERVAAVVSERLAASHPKPPRKSKWARYDRPEPKPQTTPSLTLHSARPLHGEPICTGAVMRFELEFELHEPVKQLQAGFHIFDDRKRWAFGINNVLLDRLFADLGAGRYRAVYMVTTQFAAGDYTIGFAFADVGNSAERSLYWHDGLLAFTVHRPGHAIGVGNTDCFARMVIEPAQMAENCNSDRTKELPYQPLAA